MSGLNTRGICPADRRFPAHPCPSPGAGSYRVAAGIKGAGIKRIILGHPFLVPEKWIDFPLTEKELNQSPWPFQVNRALAAVRAAIIRDGDPKQDDAVILTLPCKNVETATLLVSLTTQSPRHKRKLRKTSPTYLPRYSERG